MHGSIYLVSFYLGMVSSVLLMIILSVFVSLPLVLLFRLFIWMILLSLEVTPLVLLIRNNIWVNNSTIKTWVLFVIFLEMELFTLIVFSFLSQWKSALDFLFETTF